MTHEQNDHIGDINTHVERISREFREGFEFLKKYPRSVTIFGSSIIPSDHPSYLQATELGGRIVKELGYAVITGGGPGIMEAANRGACESSDNPESDKSGRPKVCSIQGVSAGLTISLPHEHNVNGFAERSLRFSYFFSRKAMLTFAAEAYVFFPGGYGTCDELFSVLTLIQTGKIPRVPVLLVDSAFWTSLRTFLDNTMRQEYKTIDLKDMDLFEITDSLDHVIETIKKAPVSEWWRNIN
ncbi:MAG: TIGR00730 family Rossman fold protein [Patescibacteria group bacterium]